MLENTKAGNTMDNQPLIEDFLSGYEIIKKEYEELQAKRYKEFSKMEKIYSVPENVNQITENLIEEKIRERKKSLRKQAKNTYIKLYLNGKMPKKRVWERIFTNTDFQKIENDLMANDQEYQLLLNHDICEIQAKYSKLIKNAIKS